MAYILLFFPYLLRYNASKFDAKHPDFDRTSKRGAIFIMLNSSVILFLEGTA